ncbi:hypothetical protein NQ318_020670 [Aromia moschata]|uniref:Uncharacterized protein n=1 Tax=Aromia moschata TaxID=1265417 RepID=A0AAV8XY35_9CUCU|nr:hypothetical protein NQ318_020670 [Aromia moschata]
MSKIYQCHYKADGFTVDTDKDNGAKCVKIKKAFSCDRICKDNITSSSRNVFISADNSVHQAYCDSAVAKTRANGKEQGTDIEPTQFWSNSLTRCLWCLATPWTMTPTMKLYNAGGCETRSPAIKHMCENISILRLTTTAID